MKPLTALILVMLVRVLLAVIVPLTPEEAYHWNLGRHLDWSYLDHPPMVAWSIAVGRLVFGDTELGVRLVPLLFSCGTAALLARLARRLYGDRGALWTVFLLALEPTVSVIGGWAFPDAPLFFFWTLALFCVWQAIERSRGWWWLAGGAALGAAMLSKYTAAFLVPSVLCFLLFSRERRWLATPWPYLAGVVSLAVFFPVLYWNWTHAWVSFHFQGAARFEAANEFSLSRGGIFVGEEWLGVLPLTLPLGLIALGRGARSAEVAERFLFWTFLPMMTFFAVLGFTPSFHVLWPVPAFLGLTVLMAGVVVDGRTRIAQFYQKKAGWLVGAALAVVGFVLVQAHWGLTGIPHMKEIYGWDEAAARARQERQQLAPGSFYVAVGSRPLPFPSQLAFHLADPDDVHATTVIGMDAQQYRFWDDPDKLVGKDAVLVLEDGQETDWLLEILGRYFESVERGSALSVPLGRLPFARAREQRFFFLRAKGYRKATQG